MVLMMTMLRLRPSGRARVFSWRVTAPPSCWDPRGFEQWVDYRTTLMTVASGLHPKRTGKNGEVPTPAETCIGTRPCGVGSHESPRAARTGRSQFVVSAVTNEIGRAHV